MSKPKRRPIADLLGQEDDVTSSRDHVITLQEQEQNAAVLASLEDAPAPRQVARAKPGTQVGDDETKELRRQSYHASLYLPKEAQFALREIALTMRRAKPHDVMLEAMAELFEKYNKGKLARECRARITKRG